MAKDFDVEPFRVRLMAYVNERYGGSYRVFEDSCGLTHSGIGSIGKQGPTLSFLSKIADTDAELDMNWLISGRGSMLASNKNRHMPTVNIQEAHTVNIGNWGELIELVKLLKQ